LARLRPQFLSPFPPWRPPRLALAAILFVSLPCVIRAETLAPPEKTVVTFPFYDPNKPEEGYTRVLNDLMQKDPSILVKRWGGIILPGSAGRASLLMGIAGDTAPDFYYCWWHIIKNDIRQGFLYPLNEWIGDDTNGNGQIDPEEAKWDGWAKIPPLWRRVATENGKVYGIPFAGMLYFGLTYRKDLVRNAGLDPEKPPETWDEFYYWCQRLTNPNKEIPGSSLKRGQRGHSLAPDQPWFWLPWLQAAGGSPIVQVRVSPKTGKEYVFAMEEQAFAAPDTGEDLRNEPSRWRANFSSPEGVAATAFFHKLRWAPWIRDPQTQEPINLTDADVARGTIEYQGRVVTFAEADVIRGVARVTPTDRLDEQFRMFARGEIAFQQWDTNMLDQQYAQQTAVPPELLAFCPVPAMDKAHKRVFQAHKHFISMTEGVGRRSKAERDKVWQCVLAVTSEQMRDYDILRRVLRGHAMWCRPDDLRRLGFKDYVNDVPPAIRKQFADLDRGDILPRTEPFAGLWQSAADNVARLVLSMVLAENGKDHDYVASLQTVDREANGGGMFDTPREELDRRRPTARVVFGIALMVLVVCVGLIVREARKARRGSAGMRYGGALPWLMMAPALISIALWSYYPLLRGAVMAFQDYRIVGDSRFVGLDNFIMAATDSNTWIYFRKTLWFVFLTLSLGFVAPILLALLLSEVPRGKVFFRTLFFLPQLSSGIVIALLWRILYDPTENGALNRLILLWNGCVPGCLDFLRLNTQAWLQDPALAMLCCVIPGVWAGAGIASLIYLAALRALPDDYYEAAALDGAGLVARLRHITLPQILPLIVINFVGAFIGAFQSMGSIFLLTFGGPGKETMVLDLAIWKLAYNDIRFSMATTLAWFLGVGLIAFTYFQIRLLRRVEFRRVEEN
jgi:multiple sugar transport system permease protein